MNGKEHSKGYFYIMFTPVIILLIYLNMWQYSLLALVSASVFDPDEDQKWRNGKNHRSFITHSILWSIIICLAFYWFDLNRFYEGLFVSSFPMITHLSLDIFGKNEEGKYRLFGVNRVSKYCIRFFKWRLSGAWTVIWFIMNIIIMVVYDVVFIKYL